MDGMYAKRSSRWTVGVLPLLAACYTQRPLTVPVPAVGSQIVASVTDSGIVAMSNALGPGAVEGEGVIAAADASAGELQLVRVEIGRASCRGREESSVGAVSLKKKKGE